MLNLNYIPGIIGILIVIYFLFKLSKRIIKGVISYKKLGKEEFMKRLQEGFDAITPTQRVRGELNGIVISLIGMIIGLIMNPIIRIKGFWYWIELSLLGGTIVTIWQLIGKMQQYRILKKQDKIVNNLSID